MIIDYSDSFWQNSSGFTLSLVAYAYSISAKAERRLTIGHDSRTTFDEPDSEKPMFSYQNQGERKKRCEDNTCGDDIETGTGEGLYGRNGGGGGGVTCSCTCDGLPIDADPGSQRGVGEGRFWPILIVGALIYGAIAGQPPKTQKHGPEPGSIPPYLDHLPKLD